jgi:hypothetical protein
VVDRAVGTAAVPGAQLGPRVERGVQRVAGLERGQHGEELERRTGLVAGDRSAAGDQLVGGLTGAEAVVPVDGQRQHPPDARLHRGDRQYLRRVASVDRVDAEVAGARTPRSTDSTRRYPPSRSAVSRAAGFAPNSGCCHHWTR